LRSVVSSGNLVGPSTMQRYEVQGESPIVDQAFALTGNTLVTVSRDRQDPDDPGDLKVWDTASRPPVPELKERVQLRGHSGPIHCVGLTSDGKVLASGSADKSVRLWDPTTGQFLASLDGHTSGVRRLSFAPDDRALVTGDEEGNVKLWDLAGRKELRTFPGHKGAVSALTLSSSEGLLAVAAD